MDSPEQVDQLVQIPLSADVDEAVRLATDDARLHDVSSQNFVPVTSIPASKTAAPESDWYPGKLVEVPTPPLAPENKFPIQPLGDFLIVERLKARSETKGGIIIAEAAKEKPAYGWVVATGPKVGYDNLYLVLHPDVCPPPLKPGALILFGKYAGFDIDIAGTEFVMMREDEVRGVVVEQALIAQLAEHGA